MVEDTKTPPPATDPAPVGLPPRTEVLTIDDLAPAAGVIRINGESYDLANTRTFGLRQRAKLNQLWKRLDAIETAEVETLTEADEAEYLKKLRELAAIALPTATAILGDLDDAKIGDIVIAFFAWVAMNDPRMRMLKTLTSAMPSPASSGSMAATP